LWFFGFPLATTWFFVECNCVVLCFSFPDDSPNDVTGRVMRWREETYFGRSGMLLGVWRGRRGTNPKSAENRYGVPE